MTGGFQDTEMAEDLVGVTSARLLAAGVPRGERLRAMRLLGVLVTVADARRRVRRPLAELAVEFDLPMAEVDAWLDHLLEVGAVRREGSKLVLAALEPPANGGIRLHDFLQLVDDSDGRAPRPVARPPARRLARPAGAVLAAAAVVLLALVAPAVVRDRATPVSTTTDGPPDVATTVDRTAPARSRTSTTVTTTSPAASTPGALQVGPVLVPSTTTLALPCPTGNPLVQVLGTTATPDGKLAVDGLAHNSSADEVVIRTFSLRATIAGRDVTVPGTDHELLVPGYSTVLWQATMPVEAPAGTVVRAALGDWAWSAPDIPSTCPSP